MNKVVLCETKPASKVYHLQGLNQDIESYEELCYIISKRLIYFFVHGVPEDLKNWLFEEYGFRLAQVDIKKQIEDLISYKSFFLREEKQELFEDMRRMYLLSPTKKYLMLGDNHREHEQYLSAYQAYQMVLPGISQFSEEEQGNIYYHIGFCLSEMFQYEEAEKYFLLGIHAAKDKKCKEGFFTILFLRTREEEFIEKGSKSGFTKEECKTIYENLRLRGEKVKTQNEFVKLDKIAYHKKKLDDTTERRLTKSMLERWKDEYKREIS